jgi:hypothetical protein
MVIWRGFSLCGNCSGVAWQIPRDVHDRLSDLEFVRVLEEVFAVLGENENVTHDQAIDRVLAERLLL